MPLELTAANEATREFLQSQAARVTIRGVEVSAGRLSVDVLIENLTGHKLPTAFPSRRAWLHFVVRDQNGQAVFESGALNPDGSIQGNDNDADASRFEPHYREINSADQVQIYEPILQDQSGHVTTGLSAAVGYLKDNRLLPSGFDKETAEKDIAVVGDAAQDSQFTDAGDVIRYSVPLSGPRARFMWKPNFGISRLDFAGHTILPVMTRQRPGASSAITNLFPLRVPWYWLRRRPIADWISLRIVRRPGPWLWLLLLPCSWAARWFLTN